MFFSRRTHTLVTPVIRQVITALAIYVVLVFCCTFLAKHVQPYFHEHSSITLALQKRAQEVADGMKEKNLAMNFLGNKRQLDFGEAKSFQEAGLTHLLAISGAQVSLVTDFIVTSFLVIFSLIPGSLSNVWETYAIFRRFKIIFSVLISIVVSTVFGNTGALLRATVLRYFRQIYPLQKLSLLLSASVIRDTCVETWLRVLLVLSLCVLFGNPFTNASFVLSAVGATVAQHSAQLVYWTYKSESWKKNLTRSILTAALTSFFMALLLSHFIETNVFDSTAANIVAYPIVNYIVTPLSLLALFSPALILQWVRPLFDFSLFILKSVASSFSTPYSKTNPFEGSHFLFSTDGMIALNGILILLWVLSDVHQMTSQRQLNRIVQNTF